MAICEVCGNDYEQSFQVTIGDQKYTFDCFECAIDRLAPTCAHCGCRVIGHGIEEAGTIFCCEHCARHVMDLRASLAADAASDDVRTDGPSRSHGKVHGSIE